jgi:hypothetical protein
VYTPARRAPQTLSGSALLATLSFDVDAYLVLPTYLSSGRRIRRAVSDPPCSFRRRTC